MSDIQKVVDNINIFKTHYRPGRHRLLSEITPLSHHREYIAGLMEHLSEELLRAAMKLVSAGVLGKVTNSAHHLAFYFDLEFIKMHRDFVRKYFAIEDINFIIHNGQRFPFIYFRFERRKLMAFVRTHCPFPASFSDSFITLDPLGRRGNTIAETIITFDKFSSLKNFLNECLCNLDTFLVDGEPLDYKGEIYELFDSTG